jgi:hypothetical protein
MDEKDNISNIVGSALLNLLASTLFAGLLVGVLLILKSDVTKLVQNVKNLNKKNDE